MRFLVVSVVFLVPGCGMLDRVMPGLASDAPASAAQTPDAATPRPQARPDVRPGPVTGGNLGTTVAALGDPTQPGFWLRTPLVVAERPGVVRYGGQAVAVTLIPLPDAAPGAGSQLSLQAMRALGAPLTELVEIGVDAS
jgi:hypothetical protein